MIRIIRATFVFLSLWLSVSIVAAEEDLLKKSAFGYYLELENSLLRKFGVGSDSSALISVLDQYLFSRGQPISGEVLHLLLGEESDLSDIDRSEKWQNSKFVSRKLGCRSGQHVFWRQDGNEKVTAMKIYQYLCRRDSL